MNALTRRLFPTLTALMMVFWLAACAGESQADGEGSGEESHAEEAGEMASPEAGGEHAEGGEARERLGVEGPMLLFFGYIFGLMAPLADATDSAFLVFLSIFPLTSPVVMVLLA